MTVRINDDLERLAAYQYLEDLAQGQRVLEIGCGSGLGARQLLEAGAAEVVGVGDEIEAARELLGGAVTLRRWRPPRLAFAQDDSFGLVILTDATVLLQQPRLLEEIVRVVRHDGWVVLHAACADHPDINEGMSYGALLDLVEPHFEEVRIVGQCPFTAYSLVELSEEPQDELDIMLDGGLMEGGVEEVIRYLVLCTSREAAQMALPYGIVQVPSISDPSAESSADADEAPLPPRPATLKRYTDRAGGRVSRWTWPAFSRAR
ncbi:MAG: class I SAM-dependent methyltransferase [bacterium]